LGVWGLGAGVWGLGFGVTRERERERVGCGLEGEVGGCGGQSRAAGTTSDVMLRKSKEPKLTASTPATVMDLPECSVTTRSGRCTTLSNISSLTCVQGYLAHKKPPHPSTLQWVYVTGPMVALQHLVTHLVGGVRIHPGNARMSGRHGVQYAAHVRLFGNKLPISLHHPG